MTEPFRDAGLAAERTQLAWQRYALGLAIAGILCLRAGLVGEHSVLGFGLAFVLGGLAAVSQIRGPYLAPSTAIKLVLSATLVAAAGALLLGVL